MRFETEVSGTIDSPTGEQIAAELAKLAEHGEGFAVISVDPMTYLQAADAGGGRFTLEYQEGSTDSHFVATGRALFRADVERAFRLYAAGDPGWRSVTEWQPMEVSSRRMSSRALVRAGVTLLLAAALYAVWRWFR